MGKICQHRLFAQMSGPVSLPTGSKSHLDTGDSNDRYESSTLQRYPVKSNGKVLNIRPPAPGYITLETRSSRYLRVAICTIIFGEWKPSLERAAGHELCGTVAEVGEGVTDIEIGDLVTAECFSHCGTMSLLCYRSLQSLRQSQVVFGRISRWLFGIHYRRIVNSVFKLPDMTFEQGALVEPLAVAHRALAQAKASLPGSGRRDRWGEQLVNFAWRLPKLLVCAKRLLPPNIRSRPTSRATLARGSRRRYYNDRCEGCG